VFWYQSIPKGLLDLFPAVKSVEDGSVNNAVSIVMAKVCTRTFCHTWG